MGKTAKQLENDLAKLRAGKPASIVPLSKVGHLRDYWRLWRARGTSGAWAPFALWASGKGLDAPDAVVINHQAPSPAQLDEWAKLQPEEERGWDERHQEVANHARG